MVKAHAFHDGNKRIAFLAAVMFLRLNGKDLDADETDVVQAMVSLAASERTEEALAGWIRARMVRLRR